MRAVAAAVMGLLLLAGCGSEGRTSTGAVPHGSPTPPASPAASPSALPAPSPSPSPVWRASIPPEINCVANDGRHPLALVGGAGQRLFLYDVTDPLHPRDPRCIIRNAGVHLLSDTEFEYLDTSVKPARLVRQKMAGGQTVAGSIPLPQEEFFSSQLVWRTDGGYAYARFIAPGPGSACCGRQEDHVVFGGGDHVICSFEVPIIGVGGARFFPRSVFSFSADGRYFAAGTMFGKAGGTCNVIVNPVDGSLVAKIPDGYNSGFWSAAGHRLFLVGRNEVRSWDPQSPSTFSLLTTDAWMEPQPAPGGRYIAYTYYAHPAKDGELRAGVFDLQAGRPLSGLPAQPRSQPFFVSPSLLWYLEEAPCPPSEQCIWSHAPTGRVLAFDTLTGREAAVDFGPTGSPVTDLDFQTFGLVDLWSEG